MAFDSNDPVCNAGFCTGTPAVACSNNAQCSSLRCSGAPILFCNTDPDCLLFGTCTLPPAGGSCVPTGPTGCVADVSSGTGTDFFLLDVEPGKARQLRLELDLGADSIVTELLSGLTVTDSAASGTVGTTQKTAVAICDGASAGDPCDNGDICPGDTCDGDPTNPQCRPVPCPGVCAQ